MKVERNPAARQRPSFVESDAELFRKIGEGDLVALGALYDRHHARLCRFVRQATGGDADTDDLVHDVFLTVARIAATYEDERADAWPFLCGIAANLVRARKTKRARWAALFASLSTVLRGINLRTPEEEACDAERVALANAALARLSEDKRLVLLMMEIEGLSGKEVADALGIPVATVWTRLHYARAELRASMKRRTR